MLSRIKWVWVILPTLLFSCKREDITVSLHPVYQSYPASFPQATYAFPDTEQQYHWFELGRKLFYDPILSADSTISCASCHKQEHAFADSESLSLGIKGHKGRRNSPALQNLAFSPFYMMDGGILHLETMPLAPISDTLEMGMDLGSLISKLNRHSYYSGRFKAMTKKESVSSKDLLLALTAFQSGIHSFQSLYDSIQSGQAVWKNESQEQGHQIFLVKCASCHKPPLFTDFSFAQNGYNKKDTGRLLISNQAEDIYKLKVPSLRNISISSPYMHDGGFADLDDVMSHYQNLSANQSSGIDPRLQNLRLSEEEISSLKQFLSTLTDYQMLRNTFYVAPR